MRLQTGLNKARSDLSFPPPELPNVRVQFLRDRVFYGNGTNPIVSIATSSRGGMTAIEDNCLGNKLAESQFWKQGNVQYYCLFSPRSCREELPPYGQECLGL
jgi:hypothetical protein